MDETMAHANAHMSSIVTPDRRLSARQVVAYLQGTRHVAFATTNSRGEPRVSPLDSLFIHGRFYVGTATGAHRVRHLRANPACSAVYMEGERVAVTANGHVRWIERDGPDDEQLRLVWTQVYGSDPYDMGDVVFFRIEPTSMWAFALHPKEFPE
jgi:uncharacterized pyridoxamine 5'-phosphate oxidase family protein